MTTPEDDDDSLVEPPHPSIWEGAVRCPVCGRIETHIDHASPDRDKWAAAIERAARFAATGEFDLPRGDGNTDV